MKKYDNLKSFLLVNPTGFRMTYRYYCNNEAKWVTEERSENNPPTFCINNISHVIKTESITVGQKYANLVPINQTHNFDECDLTNITLSNVDTKCELLAQRVMILEEILKRMNQIKFV